MPFILLYWKHLVAIAVLVFAITAIGTIARAPLITKLATINAQITQQNKEAADMLTKAESDVAKKEKKDRARVALIETERESREKQIQHLRTDNALLVNRLRVASRQSGSGSLPATSHSSSINQQTSTGELAGTVERIITEGSRIIGICEEVRSQLLTCQAFSLTSPH